MSNYDVTSVIFSSEELYSKLSFFHPIVKLVFKIIVRERGGLVVRASESGARDLGFHPHSSRHVVSLSKTYELPKSNGNIQEAVASSRHD